MLSDMVTRLHKIEIKIIILRQLIMLLIMQPTMLSVLRLCWQAITRQNSRSGIADSR